MKTYTLTGEVYVFSINDFYATWTAYSTSAHAQIGKVSSGYYYYVAYMFDQTVLAALRDKTATSVTLHFKTQNYPTGSNVFDISYLLSDSTTTCYRSDADSTQSVSYSLGDLYALPHTTTNNYTDLDLSGKTLPKYGYLLGRRYATSSSSSYVVLDSSMSARTGFPPATLTVVTNESTVTYDANGGENAPSDQLFAVGDTVTLSSSVPTRTGYTFLGWALTDDATAAIYSAGSSFAPTDDVTLYAVWQRNTYTVSFDANGGAGAPAAQTKTHGTGLVLSSTEPTRSGYSFAGWAVTSTATAAAYAPGATYTVDANVTLYAVWAEVLLSYTVTYDANGGSGAPDAQTKTHGTDLTLSSAVPTRTGYTFLGWALFASATAPIYASGGTYATNANVTLYAVWQITTYTVTFQANGGSDAPAAQTKRYGSALTLTNAEPVKTGFNFLGWGLTSDAATAAYAPGDSYTANADLTLYALWTTSPVPHTLQYDTVGGTAVAGETVDWDVAAQPCFTVTDQIPQKDGNLFRGWALPDIEAVAYLAGDTIPARQSLTLHAVWSRVRARHNIAAAFHGTRATRTEPVYQHDYGQGLTFPDLALPAAYEVHFAVPGRAKALTVLGDETGVAIPDELLAEGVPVLAWIYLHDGADDGETQYQITVPVVRRAMPSGQKPQALEQSIITQAIAVLQAALARDSANAQHYPRIAAGTWRVWNALTGDWEDTGIVAKGVTFTPSVSSDGVLSWTNDGGLENPESVNLVTAIIGALANAEEANA